MRNRVGAAATVAVTALLLGGCAGVPTDGSVHAGNPVPGGAANQPLDIRQLARGPTGSEKPEDIVRGFLTSSASVEDNHSIARLYLTPGAAQAWNPAARVVLYDDGATPLVGLARTSGRSGVVPLRTSTLATIGADGGYAPAKAGTRLALDIKLAQVGGQWRISNPPPGLLLTRLGLSRSFEQLTVYFLDRTQSTVVPDGVFVESNSTALATALVRRLLRGPTSWLEPAVRTAVPPGTSLIGTAPIDDRGTVSVDLSREVLASTTQQRVQLSAQLGWTLRQIPGIAKVRIQVEGAPLPGVPVLQDRDAWGSYDPSALTADATGYYRTGNQLRSVTGTPVPGRASVNGVLLDRIARSPSGTYTAGLLRASGRASVYIGGLTTGPTSVLTSQWSFTAPSWDGGDEMWTAELGPAPRILVVHPPDRATVVTAPELRGYALAALRISRDGTRVAVIAVRGPSRDLLIGRVHGVSGGGLTADAFRLPAAELGNIGDVTWADPSSVAVLAARGSLALRPWLVQADGSDNTAITTSGLAAYDEIAAAPGQPTLVASGGVVFAAQRGSWSALGRGTQPAYPG